MMIKRNLEKRQFNFDSRWVQVLITLLTLVIVELVFLPLYSINRHFVYALGLIPVLTAAFLLGLWGGVAMSLIVFGITLFWAMNAPVMTSMSNIFFVLMFVISYVAIGGFAGYIRDSNKP